MRHNSLMQPEERIQFLVGFSEADLKGLSGKHLEVLKRDVYRFIAKSNVITPLPNEAEVLKASIDDLESLRREARDALDQLKPLTTIVKDGKEKSHLEWSLQPQLKPLGIAFALFPIISPKHTDPLDALLVASGSLRDLFLLSVLLLLKEECRNKRILRCPICSRIFYREARNKKHCGPACTGKAAREAQEKWRKTPKGKSYRQKESRERYARTKSERKG